MDYLYHVTFYNLLDAIEGEGLRPGSGRGIGSAVYDTHREGAIFLTDAGGVHFWASRAEDFAQDRSEDLLSDGLVPVLLRMPEAAARNCEDDEIGSDDSNHDAYKCRSSIAPRQLEVWVGIDDEGKWRPLSAWNDIPIEEAFDEDSDGDEEWHFIRAGGNGSPLVPHL